MPTGYADRLLPALRRIVLVRETAERTDGQLLSAFVQDRDADAFAALVGRHGRMVLGVCRRVIGDADAADDAFQAVFLVLARRAAAVRPREQVGNWLYGVAYRTAIKARAVLARRRSREKQVDIMPEPPAPPTTDPWIDLHPVIDEELARLPDKLRLPVVLCDLEGRPQRAVARQLGVAPATLASRLASARRLLAGRLTRRGVTLSGGALAGVLGERASAAMVAPRLAEGAVKAAEAVSTGTAVTGLVSAHAIQMCEGVMRMMLLAKLKAVGVSALAVLSLTGGLGFGLVPARAEEKVLVPKPGVSVAAAAPKAPVKVDDATFLRRLCLDLTGNMPTLVETNYFLADADANKRRKVVEWLVADDAVRAYLAKKLGVPVERLRVVHLPSVTTGQLNLLAVCNDIQGTVTAFSPDGKTLTSTWVKGTLNRVQPIPQSPDVLVLLDSERSQLTVNGPGKLVVNDNLWMDPKSNFEYFGDVEVQLAGESGPPQAEAEEKKPQSDPAIRSRQGQSEQTYLAAIANYVVVADSDEAFLGRVVQGARGTSPTAVERKYFLEDKDPKKREKLLDMLLRDPEVAKKLGESWKKKMLETPPVAVKVVTTPIRITGTVYESRVTFTRKSDRWDQLVGELLGAKKTDEQVLEGITLAIVGRLPTDGEKRLTLAAVSKAGDRKGAWAAVARALATSDEGKKQAGPTTPPTGTSTVPPAKP